MNNDLNIPSWVQGRPTKARAEKYVQTVLGPVPVASIGRTLFHEHIHVALLGAELDPNYHFDMDAVLDSAVRRFEELKDFGVKTLVDPTPVDLGRNVDLMVQVAERTGLNIVCATGFYFERAGIPQYWRGRSAEEIAEYFIHEVNAGIGEKAIKPGVIKCATGAPSVSDLEMKVLEAACLTHKATGLPIITHTEVGVCGPEQQQIFEKHGVPLHRCVIGHSCGNPDPAYHRRIVEAGSYIGFDRVGMLHHQSDEVRADNLTRLIREGYGASLLVSQDSFCNMLGKKPRVIEETLAKQDDERHRHGRHHSAQTHLFTAFLPMLRARGVSDATFAALLEENPTKFFLGESPLDRRA
jgi:phosphotriesterase-related protein